MSLPAVRPGPAVPHDEPPRPRQACGWGDGAQPPAEPGVGQALVRSLQRFRHRRKTSAVATKSRESQPVDYGRLARTLHYARDSTWGQDPKTLEPRPRTEKNLKCSSHLQRAKMADFRKTPAIVEKLETKRSLRQNGSGAARSSAATLRVTGPFDGSCGGNYPVGMKTAQRAERGTGVEAGEQGP